MDTETIVDELADDNSRREVQLEVVDMTSSGDLVEHSEFEGVYRVQK